MWDADAKAFNTAHQLKEWVQAKVRTANAWRDRNPRAAQLLEAEDDPELIQQLEELGEHASDDQILAIVRKKKQLQRPQDASRASAPSGRDGKLVCPNCLEEGHAAATCQKPKLELKDRKCFICKRSGHRAMHCPEKRAVPPRKAIPARSMEVADGASAQVRTFCLECDGHTWEPIQRARRSGAGEQSPSAPVSSRRGSPAPPREPAAQQKMMASAW